MSRTGATSAVRRWAPWVLLVAVAVAALSIGVSSGGGRPSLDARVQHLSSEVRCPVCHGETVAQSEAAPSVEIRDEIRTDLQKGESDGQILDSIVASYGPGILEKPEAKGIDVLVWVLPVIGFVIGAAGLLWLFVRWRSRATPPVEAAGAAPQGGEEETPDPARADGAPVAPLRAPATPRRSWARIAVAATGVVFIAGGASWAVAASSGTRLPGEAITGKSLGPEEVAADLQRAHHYEARNDLTNAVKEYQKVLSSEPDQIEALTGEGWLLAGTGQPALLRQGLGLLQSAEKAQPGYAPAHIYRGLALLSEGDYGESVPELQWYLAHDPDPQLVTQVKTALTRAQAGEAAARAAGGG
jgi:cytochrome c-type biogenesis protein CcmH